ncbi:MAG: signal peptidase I [Promethearchaeota archaeon]|nr:MAG: signal peptidase I [Candidatus Lokiarchaeota archaeon]
MTANPPPKAKKKSKIKKKDLIEIAIFVAVLFTVTFGTFFIMRAALHTKTPMVVVISGSMEPTIYRGDLLFVKGTDPADINNGSYQGDPLGDIIVFEAIWSTSGEPIVHRVIDERYDYAGSGIWEFRTQGDNTVTNPFADPGWTSEEDIIGVVVGKIRYVGFVKIWLSESGLAIPLVIILALCLIVSIAWDLSHPDKEEDEKNEPKRKWFNRRKNPESPEKLDNEDSVNLGV